MRLLYALAWLVVLPFAFLYLLWRARRQPEYLAHWPERLGFGPAAGPRPRVLVHAVSLGETRAAEPLVEALLARHPDWEVLLTHATPTGRAAGRERFAGRVARAYLPYDFPPLVALFLARSQPALVIVMETEIWPGLFQGCAARGIPVFLVNARLSDRSWRGYRRIAKLAGPALASLAGLAAQTRDDAARLADLGGQNIQVMGNLKFDMAPPAGWEATGAALRARFEGRFALLAASTREGEEAVLLDLLAKPGLEDLLLVLVPRHPQRFEEVARLIQGRGLAWGRRSALDGIPAGARVVLGDSMGEMAAYYAAADLAYIGGSLLPFGGQNLIEAAALGCPALVGPHTWNFAEAAEQAVEAGAARRVNDLVELAAVVAALREDSGTLAAMAEAGRRFTEANRGATERVLELVEPAMAGARKRP
ncbi:MAG TPA: lipid IV(A) 3-deoxy-D-manno-octulosonic acid transferase [Thiobacillaceae bacterium]|nr:lipid IV(A) 3-deoxy-D-manno-octulosonic acid transferase [Thiobacillaceae bacterium]HNF89329.1 lipid IV(A) 3-deoxy-D-manno-octulosonic acid transferase [Thiobacillaceae bacterium]HNI07958.1 lipid IV(A) 3-deoxy-D-manno-octulosonic acid transferase [Thiobacillaceae bacterium]